MALVRAVLGGELERHQRADIGATVLRITRDQARRRVESHGAGLRVILAGEGWVDDDGVGTGKKWAGLGDSTEKRGGEEGDDAGAVHCDCGRWLSLGGFGPRKILNVLIGCVFQIACEELALTRQQFEEMSTEFK